MAVLWLFLRDGAHGCPCDAQGGQTRDYAVDLIDEEGACVAPITKTVYFAKQAWGRWRKFDWEPTPSVVMPDLASPGSFHASIQDARSCHPETQKSVEREARFCLRLEGAFDPARHEGDRPCFKEMFSKTG